MQIRYLLTDKGKIIAIPSRKVFVRERRKLKKRKFDIATQYKAWRGNIVKYNSYKSVKSMDTLYKRLSEVTK